VTVENKPLPAFLVRIELFPFKPVTKFAPPDGTTDTPPVPTVTPREVMFAIETLVDFRSPPAPPPPPCLAPPLPPPATTK
jgi:hypothetical protein